MRVEYPMRTEAPSPIDRQPALDKFHGITIQAKTGRLEVLQRIEDEWRELCDHDPAQQPFYRPEWTAAYVRAFVPDAELLIILARRGERLVAVLPLVRERSLYYGMPVRKLRGAANWHTCRFDLVRAADVDVTDIVRAMWCFLKELPAWDMLEFPDVPSGGALESLVSLAGSEGNRTARWVSIRSPYLTLPEPTGDHDLCLRQVDGHFRKMLRRNARKLGGEAALRLCCVDRADRESLQRFYDLERAGWKGRNRTAIASNVRTQQFYDEIAGEAARFGYLSLFFLNMDDRVIAAHFGLAYRGRYYMPKVAYDEAFKQYSPGQLIVKAILEDCLKRHFSECDYLGPSDQWKTMWTSTVRPHACLYVFRDSAYARIVYAVKSMVAPALKRVVSRLRGSEV